MEENLVAKYDVNIDLANETKQEMAKFLETEDSRVLNKLGAFASLFDIKFNDYENPVLVLKTEEPGSKQIIAARYNRLESVAYDMINHLINDCIVMGAKPLTVQDAIICGVLEKSVINKIVKALSLACKEQDCVLTGGETSEQPGVLEKGTYILTSSIVGIVERKHIVDGSKIEEGDCVLALESSGVHTNGYTLVRKIMEDCPEIMHITVNGNSFLDAILKPHRCYYKTLKDLFGTGIIRGMAHITGGGICENLNRILPNNFDAIIDLSKYKVLDIFKVLKEKGFVSDAEMLRTFNLGVGMAIVVKKEDVSNINSYIKSKGVDCYEIGQIVKGNKSVKTINTLNW